MALDRLTRITTSGIGDGVILTNPTIVGAATATSFSGDITGDVTGEVNSVKFDTNSSGVVVSGIITATTFQGGTFVGDGAGLVGVTASGSGVNVSNNDSIVGVAGTINFGTGIDVSPVSAGVVTTTVSSVTVGTGATIKGTTNTITALTNSEERLRIRSDGDVVIGTSDLESNLGSRKRLAVCDTTNGALLHLRGQSPAIFFDQSGGNIGKIFLDSVDFAIQSGTPASEGTERLRITSAGNVGIGSQTPQAKLDVSGNLSLGESSGSDNTYIDQKQNGSLDIINSGRLTDDGKIRINKVNNISGDTTNFRDFEVYDGKGTLLLKTDGSSGNIGIGTDAYGTVAPLAPLHVSSYSPTTAITDYLTLRGASQIVCQTSNNVNNSRSGIMFSGALHSTDGCSAGIIANHENVAENSETTSLSFYTSLNEVLGERLRLNSDGIMYVENDSAPTQARFGTIDGSNFENREHTVVVYGHSASDYTMLRGCNTADGTPVFDAYVSGSRSIEIEADGGVNSQGAYANISDQRLKENIIDSPSQWDDIKVLKVRKFNFTEASGYPTNTKIGFIAQEVEETSPGLVKTRYEYDEEGQEIADSNMKVVKTSVITVKAVKALQEAMARIEVLESRLNAAGIAT